MAPCDGCFVSSIPNNILRQIENKEEECGDPGQPCKGKQNFEFHAYIRRAGVKEWGASVLLRGRSVNDIGNQRYVEQLTVRMAAPTRNMMKRTNKAADSRKVAMRDSCLRVRMKKLK
jgi:hypothetical protein